jgi:hypothetical protein
MALGAGVAVLPDLVLLLFAWRGKWLPATHPLVRAHRWLHDDSLPLIIVLAWASHLYLDRHSTHREQP